MILNHLLWFKHAKCAKQVKVRIKTDKDTFYANVALDAKEAYERHDLRHFHFCIRRLLPSKHKSYPLRSYKGKIAEEPLESRSFVQQHFSELQSALIVHPRNLVASSQARNSIADYEVMSSDDQYELQKHLVHFFAGLNIHKAFGEDMVPPALLKMFPDVFARMFLPCYVSCVEHGIEPVQWSGGCLHDMPKKVHSNCVSMRRGVLL